MPAKPLFMESTEISAERTALQVSDELVRAGATQIATSYDVGKVTGLRWTMRVNGQDALFEMPARVEPVYRIFKKRSRSTWLSDREKAALLAKAERVAWRQLFRWVQAQNAMLETGMVEPLEVFAAYCIPPGQDRTMFQLMMEKQFKMLAAPAEAV